MKYALYIASTFLFSMCSLFAIAQNPKGYTINGQITGAKSTTIYLRDASYYRPMAFKDSASTDSSGHFAFRGAVTEPCIAYIEVKNVPGGLQFILENTNIKIDGELKDFWNATVSGSK